MDSPYTGTAEFYDLIYRRKDYAAESARLLSYLGADVEVGRCSLLDVACGTGLHLEHLRAHFARVEGLDLNPALLELARGRNPGVTLHEGDMTDFNLGHAFDVVTCLFHSIAYLTRLEQVRRAVQCMALHVAEGGVLLIEPWHTPASWQPGCINSLMVDDVDLKIMRMATTKVEGSVSSWESHHLIGTREQTRHVVERHELGLYETKALLEIVRQAGLREEWDGHGLAGLGMLIGRR